MNRNSAYVWRRQFSWDQMQKVEAIKTMRRRFLPPDLVEQARFARCQLRDTNLWYNTYHSFDGVWQGEKVRFDPVIRPLFTEYAVAIYRQVLADVLTYYPTFQRYEVTDGPLVGERRLFFPDKLDEAASSWMQSRARYLMEHSDIAVSESCQVRPGERHGEMVVDVRLDQAKTDRVTRNEVAAIMADGQPFPTDPRPRKCDPNAALEMFAELSLPELVLLNWDKVRKQPSAADRMLLDAASRCDYHGVKAALEAGADPNCVADDKVGGDTPLTAVVSYCPVDEARWHSISGSSRLMRGLPAAELIPIVDLLVQAGAAVDWVAPDQNTPLAEAALAADADVIRHLLKLGADPSVRCYSDEHEMDVGTAWEYADFRCNPVDSNDDASARDALCELWPEPFGGWSRKP